MSLCLPRELAFGANMNLNLFYWKKNSCKENETNTELCRRQISLGVEHRQKLLGRWASTRINSFLSSTHSPLRNSVSLQFSYPFCPSQVIFPSPPFQTFVSMFGKTDLLIAFLIQKKKEFFIASLTRRKKKEI